MLSTIRPGFNPAQMIRQASTVKFSAETPTAPVEGPKTVAEAIAMYEQQQQDFWKAAGESASSVGLKNTELAMMVAETQRKTPFKIHDFRVGGWGHSINSIAQSPTNPERGRLTGFGENIRQGDFLIVGGKKYVQLVKVESVEYKRDPNDMFTLECSAIDAIPATAS